MSTSPYAIPRAMGPRIVVERKEADERTPGGIALPDTAKQKKGIGVVVSVGRGRLAGAVPCTSHRGEPFSGMPVYAPIDVQVGDEVAFFSHSGIEIKHHGRTYLVLGEEEVLAVLPPPPVAPARAPVDETKPHKYNREPNCDGRCEDCQKPESDPIHDDPVVAAERALEAQGIPT